MGHEPRPSLGFAALSTKLEEHFDVACYRRRAGWAGCAGTLAAGYTAVKGAAMTDFLHLIQRGPVQRLWGPAAFVLTPLLREASQQGATAASSGQRPCWKKGASLTVIDARAAP